MSYNLTELVRLLEQRGHIFPTDPHTATEQLHQTNGDTVSKLHRRAVLIDRDHALNDRLHRQRRHLHYVLYVASGAWLVLGFMGTYGLMQYATLNFFLILVGILGMNTLMLLVWLIQALRRHANRASLPPFLLGFNQQDAVNQAILQLYTAPAFRPYVYWRKSVMTHRLALMGLVGMFASALMLLLVRQYRFNWESTLLNDGHFAKVVAILAWLPDKLGFSVPNAQAVMAGRNLGDIASASAWGSLLLGSIVCYGILPRLVAWLYCLWRVRQTPPQLDLSLPYYQNILQQWQRRIIDSDDDYRPDQVRTAPTISVHTQGAHWAVLLDAPHDDGQWFKGMLGVDWLDKGVIADRDGVAELTRQLGDASAVQVLVGIRAMQTPDRGTIRRLNQFAEQAQGGLVVYLWADEDNISNYSEILNERLNQWHDVLQQHGWAWIDPPTWSQRKGKY